MNITADTEITMKMSLEEFHTIRNLLVWVVGNSGEKRPQPEYNLLEETDPFCIEYPGLELGKSKALKYIIKREELVGAKLAELGITTLEQMGWKDEDQTN